MRGGGEEGNDYGWDEYAGGAFVTILLSIKIRVLSSRRRARPTMKQGNEL
jgi:hypothetical protein